MSTPSLPTTESLFPQPGVVNLCSYNECSAGHKFTAQLALARCPGCQQAILAVKMVQCPVCNEPVSKMLLRTDHMPQGGGITPMCQGAASLNDVGVIEVGRTHAKTEQETYVEREMIQKL